MKNKIIDIILSTITLISMLLNKKYTEKFNDFAFGLLIKFDIYKNLKSIKDENNEKSI